MCLYRDTLTVRQLFMSHAVHFVDSVSQTSLSDWNMKFNIQLHCVNTCREYSHYYSYTTQLLIRTDVTGIRSGNKKLY